LEPAWRSGQFFQFFAVSVPLPFYSGATRLIPAHTLAVLMSWFTIITELLLSVAFLFRGWWKYAIRGSLAFHFALTALTRESFGTFAFAVPACMLAFVEWPTRPVLILYDPDYAFCRRVRLWLTRFDFDRILDWQPCPPAASHAPATDTRREWFSLHSDQGLWTGYAGIRQAILYFPVTYLLIAAGLSVTLKWVSHSSTPGLAWLVFVLAVLPLAAPNQLGNMLCYRLVRPRD
jgi:hypothetical protein